MSMKISDLYKLSDDEVITRHDNAAEHTVVGTGYWMAELERRRWERVERSNTRLARASTVLSIVSVTIAVVALFVR